MTWKEGLAKLGQTAKVAIFVLVVAVVCALVGTIVMLAAFEVYDYDVWVQIVLYGFAALVLGLFIAMPLMFGLVGGKLAMFYLMSFMTLLIGATTVLGLVLDKQNPNNDKVEIAAYVTSGVIIAIAVISFIYIPVYVKNEYKQKQ